MRNKALLSLTAIALLLTGCGSVRETAEVLSTPIETPSAETEAPDTESTDIESTDTELPITEMSDTEATETEVLITEMSDTEAADTEVSDTEAADTEAAEETVAPDDAEEWAGLIPGVRLGMTKDEVFAMYGEDYDFMLDKYSYSQSAPSVEYEINCDFVPHLGVKVQAYRFFEFDREDDTLVGYGYHFGTSADTGVRLYPLTAEELEEIAEPVHMRLRAWYGTDTETTAFGEQGADQGILSEAYWPDAEEGEIWMCCGVNLWNDSTPDTYETGINEVVVSCIARRGE